MAVHPRGPPPLQPASPSTSSPQPHPRHIPTPTRYQLPFPAALDALLAPFDDPLIQRCQRRTSGLVHLLSMSLTFFTSIEVSLVFPAALYALGYDAAAGLCTSVLVTLAIASQLPKKFIHRPRPWMVRRARAVRTDSTSSFPSRAVVCAVVFSWLLATSLRLEGLTPPPNPLALWAVIVLMALLAAFARVNVGAHYPSDTVAGFLLGLVVVHVGARLEASWALSGCHAPSAYPVAELVITRLWTLVTLSSWRTFVGLTVLAYLVTLVSMQGFWVKCSYVYALLLSPATFRATYLCAGRPRMAGMGGVARVVEHGDFREHLRVGALFSSLLLFGMATRGRKGRFRVLVFSVIYLGALWAMLAWRLRVADDSGVAL